VKMEVANNDFNCRQIGNDHHERDESRLHREALLADLALQLPAAVGLYAIYFCCLCHKL
jgi:hypothetical protein